MTDDQIGSFVQKICEKTNRGEIGWQKTADPSLFRTTIAGYIIEFATVVNDRDPDVPFQRISVLDEEGSLIDSFTAETLAGAGLSQRDAYRLMQTAFVSARRQVMGIAKAIEEITQELKRTDPPAPPPPPPSIDDIPF